MDHEFDKHNDTQVKVHSPSGGMTDEQVQAMLDILAEIFNRYSGLDVEIKFVKTK